MTSRITRLLVIQCLLGLLASTVSTQSTSASRIAETPRRANKPSQFQQGDLYLCAAVADGGCTSGSPGILRYSPATNELKPLVASYGLATGSLEFDPFRDRILCPTAGNVVSEIDSAGRVRRQIPALALFDMATTGSGEVYFTTGGGLWYIDADDCVHPVVDQATGNPYGFSQVVQVEYDAPTHSVLALSLNYPCPTSVQPGLMQLFLSPDGSAVTSAAGPFGIGTCGFSPLSLDPGRNGLFLMVESSGATAINVDEISPQSLASTLFAKVAVNQYAFGTGTYSNVLAGAVCVDIHVVGAGQFVPEMQLLAQGTCGLGTVLQTSSNYPASCIFHSVSDIEEIRH